MAKKYCVLLFSFIFLTGAQVGCIWKLWMKTPIEERIFDVYGSVKSVNETELVVQTRQGEQLFSMSRASIKGSGFDSGAYVHVFYRLKGDIKEVTMVVEKIE